MKTRLLSKKDIVVYTNRKGLIEIGIIRYINLTDVTAVVIQNCFNNPYPGIMFKSQLTRITRDGNPEYFI